MARPTALFLGLLALGAGSGCNRKQAESGPLAEAKHLYDSVCAKCHGRDGRGGVPSAEGQPAPRNFQDPAFHASRSDDDLKLAIRKGKGPMPPFGAMVDDVQTANLVLYIRSFNAKK
jgi:mono/diheme cytochrome c family protein